MVRAAAMLLLIGFLSACAGGPRYSEAASRMPPLPDGLARLTFFRESSFVGVFASTRVKVDGATVGTLDSGTTFHVDRPPGTVTVSVDNAYSFGTYDLPLTVEAGKEYFLRVANRASNVAAAVFLGPIGQGLESASQGGRGGAYQVDLVSRAAAMSEITGLTVKSPD